MLNPSCDWRGSSSSKTVFNPASSVLASVPLLLSHGGSYSLEAQAAGERLTVTFDGRAAYQDVLVAGSG